MAGKGVRYAGFWRRLGAFLLDTIIILALFFGIILIAWLPMRFLPSLISGILAAIAILAAILVALGYHTYFLVKTGATPGKDVLGLVVVDRENSYPIQLKDALLREVLGRIIVDRLTAQLGNLLIIFDPRKQSLHDKIGSTYVVHKDSLHKE